VAAPARPRASRSAAIKRAASHGQAGGAQQRGPWLALYSALIGWAFERFYREFSWTYDGVAWLVSRGLWYHWAAAALPFLRGRVLELGCGTGHMQRALAQQHPAPALGLDVSPQMLGHTRRRLRRAGAVPRLLRGVAQALPLAGGSVQSVLATFPTSYILHPATLAEIRRVLSSDGRLVVVDAAHFTRQGSYERLVDLAYRLVFLRGITHRDSSAADDTEHPYTAHFEQAGFAVQAHPRQVGSSSVLVFVATPR
jgi:ubiquinone/menaquinone biosynthesis C-methylase UbiE